MKKSNLLLLLPTLMILSGCVTESEFIPSKYNEIKEYYDSLPPAPIVDPDELLYGEDDLKCTYNFYFSYSCSTKYNSATGKVEDAPLYTMEHKSMLKPLGSIPAKIKDEEAVISLGNELGFEVDPTFPKFLGFSFYGVALDETNIWDFKTDYKQLAVINLYGVWVSED